MALTRIRQSNITQPLDADLDTLSLSANGNITATGDLTVGGNTAITGALTAGSIGVSGDVNFGDGDKAIFNNNLEIYGDGVTSRIDEVSTGNLAFKASNLYLKSYGTNEDYITAIEDGAVSLFHGSSATAKLATTSTGVDITGDLLVSGDFTVSGNTTFINSDNLAIEDLNIVLANGAANSAVADGAGITIDGAGATITYDSASNSWNLNKSTNFAGSLDAHYFTSDVDGNSVKGGFFLGGTNHGLYRDAGSNDVQLYTTGGKLHLHTNGFNSQASVGLIVDDSNKVGIGTASPATALDVTGTVTADGLTVDNNSGDGEITIAGGVPGTTDGDAKLNFIGSTAASGVAGYANIRVDVPSGGRSDMYFQTALSGGSGGVLDRLKIGGNGNIQFYENNGGTPQVGMHWDYAIGRLGIGTDSPVAPLHIQGNNGTNGGIRIHNSGGNPYSIWSDQDKLYFSQGNGSTTAIAIEYGGNVGIKNDNPTVMFEVGKLESGNTGLAIFNSEGGNEVGLKVQSRTNRATLQVSDNDTSNFVQAEDGHAIYGQHSGLENADMTIDTAGNMNLLNGAYKTEQIRHNIRPTLNLDFANSKQLDSRIVFTRESIGTYYDENGIIKYAKHNEPRFDHNPATLDSKGLLIEEDSGNQLISSGETASSEMLSFRSVKDYGGYTIANSGLAPNGKYQATALYGNGDASAARMYFSTNSGNYTFSVYAKDNGSGRFGIWVYASGWIYTNSFYWSSGVLTPGSGTNTHIQDVGNGWYRISVYYEAPSTGSIILSPGLYSDYQDNDSTLFWGAQLESKRFATSYVPTRMTFRNRDSVASYFNEDGLIAYAPKDEARYGYSTPYREEYFRIINSTPTLIKRVEPNRNPIETDIILEQEATNLVTHSFDNARVESGFVSDGSYAVTNETPAPDGTYTASKWTFSTTETGNSGYHSGIYGNFTVDRWYTYSSWIKGPAGKATRVALLAQGGGNVEVTVYLTGDWQKVVISKYFTSSDPGPAIRIHACINRGPVGGAVTATSGEASTYTDYVYLWGFQIEEGNSPTSYIPTYGATATRAADIVDASSYTREQDVAEIHSIEGWYNSEESTIFGEATSITRNRDVGSNPALFGITDGTSNNRYLIRRYDNDVTNDPSYAGFTFRLQINDGTTIVNNDYFVDQGILPEWDDEGIHKMALAIAPNSQIAAADGIDAQMPSLDSPVYDTATMAQIGDAGSSAPWNGHIRKLSYYPTQFSLTELIALTEKD